MNSITEERKLLKMKSLQTLALLIALLAINGIRPSFGQTPASYYFDSEKGNDKLPKCDINHPFQSLAKAGSLDLKPGDQLFFKRGGYWRGQLHPKGSGSASSPIKIDCYGNSEDPLPLIEGAGAESAVLLDNQQNWILSNIAVSNLTPDVNDAHHGIIISGNNAGELSNIKVTNIIVNEIQGDGSSCGIYVRAGGKTIPTFFNHLVITGCFIKKSPFNGIYIDGGQGTLPGGQGWERLTPKQKSIKFLASRNILISNNMVNDGGWSGIFVSNADAPLITHNLVAGSNWNISTGNGYGIGLWVANTIDAMQEYNEVFGTLEPFNGTTNDADGNAFDISRSLRCTYRYNFTHDNKGGFMLIDNYNSPTIYKGNIVNDNLSLNDELELFQLMGDNTTRIYNNIFHTSKGLDYKPCLFYCNPSGTPTDAGNIAEPSDDILVMGNVFSLEPGAGKASVFMPGRMDFEGWRDTTIVLNGIQGGIDFGQNIWQRGSTNKPNNKYMILNKNEPISSAAIDFSPRGIKLHSIDISGSGTVILSSGNPGNPTVKCLLNSTNGQYQTFETNWRFPAGIVTFEISNPDGVSKTRLDNIENYKEAFTFSNNYFINTPEPSDAVHKGYIENFNNKVLSSLSELPSDKAASLDSLINKNYYAINFLTRDIPTDEWINKSYNAEKEIVAKIDGEPIYAVELSLAMDELRPAELALTKSARNSKEADKLLKEKAMQLCYQRKMAQIIARERGVISNPNIFTLLWDMEQQNARHAQKGNLFFGPEILTPAVCISYYYRNLTILLPRLMKDAEKQKFEEYLEQRIAKAKISDKRY